MKNITYSIIIPHKNIPKLLQRCLDYYEGRHFITSQNENLPTNLRYDQTLAPKIQTDIALLYGFDRRYSRSRIIQTCTEGLIVYPSEYFDDGHVANFKTTSLTICRHLTLHSWNERETCKHDKVLVKEKIFFVFILPLLRKLLWKMKYIVIRFD